MLIEDISEYYDVQDIVGEGATSMVYRGQYHATGVFHALKVISMATISKEQEKMLADEIEIMKKVDHPNLVQMYEVYETKDNVVIAMELLQGKELFDAICDRGAYTEQDAAKVTFQITNAVKYLNSIGVSHRDLKPENIVYATQDEDSEVIITDLGLAKLRTEEGAASFMQTSCGTPGYVAPEVISNTGYGMECDMWSVGVIMYALLCGYVPFYEDPPEVYESIREARYEFPEEDWDEISAESKDLISKLLVVDPKVRLTPDQVLAHSWLSTKEAKHLGNIGKKMKSDVARRKLRMAGLKIITANRFKLAK